MGMKLAERIIEGERIESVEELLALVENTPRESLFEATHTITRTLCGEGFDTCAIINVKSGRCSEDCKWCAQSSHFATGVTWHDVLPWEAIRPLASENARWGIKRLSLVASGRRPSPKEVTQYAARYRALREAFPHMSLCASMGLADKPTLQVLFEAGCSTYHCNMESAPSFFSQVCTTHTQAEKEATLRGAKEVGMRCCSGGIIGMGESRAQRAELALYLHSLGIESIPINVLHPIPGTPLAKQAPLDDEEFLLAVALFRLANPRAFLRFSGGRAQYDEALQQRALYVGMNAAITGNLLTTKASDTERDAELFRAAGYRADMPTDWVT